MLKLRNDFDYGMYCVMLASLSDEHLEMIPNCSSISDGRNVVLPDAMYPLMEDTVLKKHFKKCFLIDTDEEYALDPWGEAIY